MWQAAPALRHIKSRKRQRLSKAISHNTHHIPAPATPSLRATLYPTPTPDRPLSLKMAFVSVFTGLAVAARTPVAVCRTRMALEGGKSSGGGTFAGGLWASLVLAGWPLSYYATRLGVYWCG
eukprot:TRINITY_DN332_c0_g1_i6.p3 TRINITY_DN332_c0_g1~~TRINITY_DN332_c0_g1_i6.p3  ORF type:complete len:122 (+),score=5.89 TRINITY_DN332_c0_g1_i6:135-500(+)